MSNSNSIHMEDAVECVEQRVLSETSVEPDICFRSTTRRKVMKVSANVNDEEYSFQIMFGGFFIRKNSLMSSIDSLIDDIKMEQCDGIVTDVDIDRNS